MVVKNSAENCRRRASHEQVISKRPSVNCRWRTLHKVSLSTAAWDVMIGALMNNQCGGNGCKSQEAFQVQFQQRLRERLDSGYTLAEGFGPAWETALELVPLEDEEQGIAYRHLIEWARS